MKKVELHAKSKYGLDCDSVIDIEALLWNALENGEKGIVIADKDSIIAFPKIEKIYNKLCLENPSFKNFKVGYGVQITGLIEESEQEIIILVKNQHGLKNLYKIMSLYMGTYKNKMPLNDIFKNSDGLLIGLILNDSNINLDLSLFDYIEVNDNLDVSNIDKKNIIVFSNNPNSFFPGDIKALEVLYFRKKINRFPKCRLYLNTEETLEICDNQNIVIKNTNLIFDKLENIIINDEKFHTTQDNFNEFANLVKTSFHKKIKNPSIETQKRLEKELSLIKELNYTYYFKILTDITKYCKDNNEYYELDGYINNSLVSFILDITTVEPFKLPYELFFSEIPKIELQVSPKFFNEKLSTYINQKFKNKIIKCAYGYKLSNITIPSTIKRYEKKTKKQLNLSEKDYICNLLNQVLMCKELSSNSYFIIPNNMDIEDFTPYETTTTNNEITIKSTHFDYFDLNDNLIKINFLLSEDIEFITNLRNATNTNIQYCTEKRVYDLFKNTEPFNTKFTILDRTSGLLNINNFDTKEIERKLKRIPNLWLNDLINVLVKVGNLIIIDDLYNSLHERNLDDVAIFNVINYLKETKKTIASKSTLINKVRISYMQMYYKLYYPNEYYKEMLSNYNLKYIKDKILYKSEDLKKKYIELKNKINEEMTLEDYKELGFLEIFFEMWERNIEYKIVKNEMKVVVK